MYVMDLSGGAGDNSIVADNCSSGIGKSSFPPKTVDRRGSQHDLDIVDGARKLERNLGGLPTSNNKHPRRSKA
jgi:hypothetical protein